MTRALRRIPHRTTCHDAPPTLVDRYVGTEGVAALAWQVPDFPIPIDFALIDTTEQSVLAVPEGHVGWWHPLWIRDEPNATVQGSGTAAPVAPGDAMTLATGGLFAMTGGQLGVLVTLPGRIGPTSTPSHGLEHFHGNQRHTALPAPFGLEISRWKLTGPLPLDQHHHAPAIVITLAGEPVLTTRAEVLPVPRGMAVQVDPTAGVTVHPGALAYLLLIEPVRSQTVAPGFIPGES